MRVPNLSIAYYNTLYQSGFEQTGVNFEAKLSFLGPGQGKARSAHKSSKKRPAPAIAETMHATLQCLV